jgi:DNA (cytosine-5)-methyltransferase 1
VNYYNENDKQLVAWLHNLIDAGLIAPGIVDDRSIEDVRPTDLDGFVQCHFFAGIGVWSHALRRAGWPDDRPVWTGSCPCQPFSAAGKGGGFADERHLWPAWHHLIAQRRPAELFGEQVASKDGLAWVDLVQTDLEGSAYAFGKNDLCAAGVKAPHIRQRLFFVADAISARVRDSRRSTNGAAPQGTEGNGSQRQWVWTDARHDDGLAVGLVADADGRNAGSEGLQRGGQHGQLAQDGGFGLVGDANRQRQPQHTRVWQEQINHPEAARTSQVGLVDDTEHSRLEGHGRDQGEARGRWGARIEVRPVATAGVAGFWDAADWIPCRDGKARPVEPGTFPLAHGVANRVGRLRAYGNAIVAPLAEEFIRSYLEATCDDGLDGRRP